jgi:hypothetical protein
VRVIRVCVCVGEEGAAEAGGESAEVKW